MRHHIIKIPIILFLLTATLSCNEANGYKQDKNNNYYVTKVVDGDTFWANNGAEKDIKVRLIGIDAPESRKTGKKEIGYFGKEAKDYLTKLLSEKYVKLVSDVDSLDRYGRTLAYVYLQNGMFVNAELVQNGYAVVMTIPPNVKYADLFLKLQTQARENKRGLWN